MADATVTRMNAEGAKATQGGILFMERVYETACYWTLPSTADHRLHGLLDRLLRRNKLFGMPQAEQGERFQHFAGDRVDGRLDGRELIHDAHAISVLLDHFLNAFGLTLNAFEAGGHIVPRIGGELKRTWHNYSSVEI